MLIDIPCKIGDEVYAIRMFKGKRQVKKGIVTDMHFLSDRGRYEMKLVIVVGYICRGCWGERVFGSYEEALEAAKGGRGDG